MRRTNPARQCQVLKGRLDDRTSRLVTVRRETPGLRAEFQREDELRLDFPRSIRGPPPLHQRRADEIPLWKGDTVTFVCTIKGDGREDLLVVSDHTTGEPCKLGSVGETARKRAALVALVLGIGPAVFT